VFKKIKNQNEEHNSQVVVGRLTNNTVLGSSLIKNLQSLPAGRQGYSEFLTQDQF